MLTVYLANIIKTEIEAYFQKFDSFEKIIDRRDDIDARDLRFNNSYELLIYASLRTKEQSLLNLYLEKKLSRPVTIITHSECLEPGKEIDETAFLSSLKLLAKNGDFAGIENEIVIFNNSN